MSKGKKKRKRQQKQKKRLAETELQVKKNAQRKEEKRAANSFFEDRKGHVSQSMRKKFAKERVAALTNTTVEQLVKKERRAQAIKPKSKFVKRKRKKTTSTPEPTEPSLKKKKHSLDIWASSTPTGKIQITSNNFTVEVEDPKAPVYKRNKAVAERGILKDGTQVCHAGASFHPSEEDHKVATEKALEQHREEMKPINRVKNMYRKIEKFAKKQTWRKKPPTDGAIKSEEEEEEPDTSTPPPKRAPVNAEDRKTRVQRNKEKRKRIMEKVAIRKKWVKRRRKDLDRFDKIVEEFNKDEEEKAEKREKRDKSKAERNDPPVLGKLKFQPEFPVLQEKHELQATLRKIKPSQSLFDSIAKNFERRNILEPRQRAKQKRPKFKPKYYTRKNHKENVY